MRLASLASLACGAWRHPRPRRCAVLALALAGCPGGADEDDSTTGPVTTSLTGTGSDTEGPEDTATPEPTDTTGCSPGLPGCACLPGDTCSGELVCEAGTCRDPSGSDSGSGGDTTTGTPAVCGNGMAEPGDLCLSATSTPFAMGAGSIAIAIANFDADPALDLVVANRDANTISIRLGDGTGDFGVQTPFSTGTGPVGVGAGDFDGDGDLDLATANVGTFDVSVLPGSGNGNFGPAVATLLGDMITPTDLAVADLDGDGDPDVLVTESTLALVHVLRRDLGAFLTTVSYGVGGGPSAVHVADFSNDARLDVVTANAAAGSVSLLLGNGFGQLGGASSAVAGTTPADVGSGDFNGDGDPDTIVANPDGNVSLSYGNGLGGLGPSIPFPVAGGPAALVATDLDLDGDTDVAVASSDGMVHVLLGDAAGSVETVLDIVVGQDPQDIAAADLDGDGLLDLVTANVASGNVSVILTDA